MRLRISLLAALLAGFPLPVSADPGSATPGLISRVGEIRAASTRGLTEVLATVIGVERVAEGAPVALGEAVDLATKRVSAATAGVDPGSATALLAWLASSPPLPTVAAAPMTDPEAALTRGVRAARRWEREALQRIAPIMAEIDRPSIRTASVDLVAAVESSLPSLRRFAALDRTTGEVEGCDVLDALPVLCVGGGGDNTYTEDAALQIDLGGEDRYENTAGGGNALNPDSLPVAVTIDLAGDDVYDRASVAGDNTVQDPAQGAGISGIGILVDVTGDDIYIARGVLPPDPAEVLGVRVDGHGEGVLGGVGLLADLGGRDTYLLDASASRPADLGAAFGQGTGAIGDGLLLDLGGSGDRYELRGGTAGLRPSEAGELPDGGKQDIEGQGNGSFGGTGVLLDDGGADTLRLAASTDPGEQLSSYQGYEFELGPSLHLYGQGRGAVGGAGMALLGTGPTTYAIEATGRGLGYHQVFSQASADLAGVGVLDDLGGDDIYLLSSQMDAAVSGEVAEVYGQRTLTTQDMAGQAQAKINGAVALLGDHGGDDRYTARYSSTMIATARAEGDARALAVSFAAGPMWVQGSAFSASSATLFDESGDDVYDASLRVIAEADAESERGEAAGEAFATWVQPGFVTAQGATGQESDVGALIDRGGSDAYLAVAQSLAAAAPDPLRAWEGGGMAQFQGSGPNAQLVDEGPEVDEFISRPNFEDTCQGHRGEAPGWVECPPGASDRADEIRSVVVVREQGQGRIERARTKVQPVLELDGPAAVDVREGDLLIVRGTLRDPSGAPVPGASVDARLQVAYAFPRHSTWIDASTKYTLTDVEGSFVATIVVPAIDRDIFPGDLRVWVGSSGDSDRRGASDGFHVVYR